MERGRILMTYRPPRAHPILYAGLMLTSVVFVMGSIENLLRGPDPALFGWYALPVAAILVVTAALWPSDTRIYEHGIEPSRALALGGGRFIPWSRLAAVYPTYYDVTGAFVSPFASSDGKVTQMGLGLEHRNGRITTVAFTPSRFERWNPESKGYLAAIDVVRERFADMGRPLVPQAERMTDSQRQALIEEAGKPFLPFFTILLLIALAAPIIAVLSGWLGLPVWLSLPIGLASPIGIGLKSWTESRKRNAILNRVSRAVEYEAHTLGADRATGVAAA